MNFLVIVLLIILPLICQRLFGFFGFDINITNLWYEALKSNFLIFITPLFLLFFFFSKINLKISKKNLILIYSIIWVFFISSFFWINPENSFLWENTKWHTFFFWVSVFSFFIIFSSLKKEIILKSIIYSSIPVWFLALKESFFPSFGYWDFWNRAIWTFWHHNYLALFLILIIPLITNKLNKKRFLALFIFLNLVLILTKSLIWISVILCFYIYLIYKETKNKAFIIIPFLSIFSWILFYIYENFNKIMSLISRFYIWFDSILIWFSNFKFFLIWIWSENLYEKFIFFKSKELLIYENLWFSADRSHNFILDFFVWFWIIWWGLILYFLLFNFKKIENKFVKYSLLLSFIFLLFNFPSSSCILIIFALLSIWINKINSKKIFLIPLLLLTFIWSFVSYKNIIWEKINIDFKKDKIILSNLNLEICENNLKKDVAEIYFLCWDLYLKNNNKKEALDFFNKWINSLPILENYPEKIKYSAERRLNSEKYGLKEIQKKIERLN